MNKVSVITRSLRCYHRGWLSLIPIFGIPFLVGAFWYWHRVRAEAGKEWNPAKRYLIAGYILAWFGVGVLLATLAAVAVHCMNS